MSSFNRLTYLATVGNLSVKAGGQDVIIPDSSGSEDVYNVMTGEIVVWNPKTNKSLSLADVATAPHIAVSVGAGVEGALAEDLIYIGGEDFNMCKTTISAEVTSPQCGLPQIVDIFFDCTKCNDVYTIALHLDDTRVRSQYGYNEKAEYVFSIPTECCNCDDCDPTHNCEEVACALVDAINGNVQKDPSKITYFQKADLSKQYQPFTATRLFNEANSSKQFCLNVSDTACEDCAELNGITGIRVSGQDYPFLYTTKPGDTTKTLPSQLKRVVNEINRTFEANDIGGSAILTNSIGKCCPYSIEINSCENTIQLITDGGNVDPCSVSNPFSAQDLNTICKGCGVEASQINLNCGIRIIVDPLEVPCDCKYPPNIAVPNTYSRTVEPAFVEGGWVCNNHYWKVAQEQELPEGFGYFWQDKAHYGQHNGGGGRDWRYSNRRVGRIGLPDEASRAENAHNLIKCDETYCTYNVLVDKHQNLKHNNQGRVYNTNLAYILIPQKHDVTKASWEQYLAALQARGACAAGNITCDPDLPIESVTISGCPVGDQSVAGVGTVQLTSAVLPAEEIQDVTWSSDDEAVATVDADGLVTLVAPGSVTITATSDQDNSVSDTCAITVVA